MEHNLPKLAKEPNESKQSSKIHNHLYSNNNNKKSNDNSNNSNSNNVHVVSNDQGKNLSLPLLNEKKRIYIHKPSDFIKNKYTFLGNLANNSELLSSGENKKSYHLPKFSMKDIKRRMSIENQIIGSILKDEVESLPSLLRNLIPAVNKNKNRQSNKESLNKSGINDYEYEYNNNNNPNYIYNNNSNNKFLNGNNNYNNNNYNNSGNRNDIKAYGLNAEQIAQRASRLVNLNFLISSGRKKREPKAGRLNYKELFGDNVAVDYGYQAKSSGKRGNNYMMGLDYLQMHGIRK